MAAAADLVEVGVAASAVALPHRCARDEVDAPIPYEIGPRGRARLAAGETVPVTARCRRCDERVCLSRGDPGARAARAARPGPERVVSIRPKDGGPRGREALLRPPAVGSKAEPCPACGVVPNGYGLCRCSS